MRRYLALFFLFVGLAVGAVFCLNAWFDPYSDFFFLTGLRAKPPLSGNEYGERKYKAALLRSAPPDSFRIAIFGNSRATAIDPGEGALNLAFAGASLMEMAAFADLAKARHPSLIPVFAVDFEQCYSDGGNLLYITDASRSRDMVDALQRLFSLETLRIAAWGRINRWSLSELEIRARGNTVRRLDYTDRGLIAPRVAVDIDIYRRVLSTAAFRENCVDRMGQLRAAYPGAVLMVNPPFRTMTTMQDGLGLASRRKAWLDGLAATGPVLNFGCSIALTDDQGNYADAHHYSERVGQFMMADIERFLAGQPPALGCVLKPAPPSPK